MYQWNDEHQMIRAAVRQYVEAEIEPLRDELEFGDLPPYDLLRGLFATFGMDQMARDGFDRAIERERAAQVGEDPNGESAAGGAGRGCSARPVDDVDPHHRVVSGVPGHGHGDGRVDGVDRIGNHVEGHNRPEGAMGS